MADKFKVGDIVKIKGMEERFGVLTHYNTDGYDRFAYFRQDNGVISGGWFDSSLELVQEAVPAVPAEPQTPVQKAGYKIGDKFRMKETNSGFTKGDIITLERDDSTALPMFSGPNTRFNLASGRKPGAYISLLFVEKVEPVPVAVKAGDRVIVTKVGGHGFERHNLGKRGTVVRTDKSDLPIYVKFDDARYDWGKVEELQILPETQENKDAIVKGKLDQIKRLVSEIEGILE